MMTTCTSLRSFVLSMLVCILVTLASEFSNVVDAVIVSLDRDREECITTKIDVGVDQDGGPSGDGLPRSAASEEC